MEVLFLVLAPFFKNVINNFQCPRVLSKYYMCCSSIILDYFSVLMARGNFQTTLSHFKPPQVTYLQQPPTHFDPAVDPYLRRQT